MDGDQNQQEKANTARPRLEIELPPPIPAGRRAAPATGQQAPDQPPKPSTGGLRVTGRHAQERRETDQPTLTPESPPLHPDSSRTKSLVVADPAPPVPANQENERNQPHGDGFEPTYKEGSTSNKPSSPKPASPELNGCLLVTIIGAVVFAIICLIVALSDGPATQNVSQTAYSTTSQDTTNSQSALTPQSTPTPTPTPLPPHVVLNATGKREPAPGYQWANDDPNDFRVIPKATPTPTPEPLPPHVVLNARGQREAAPGYQWANDDPNDFRVIPKVTPTPTPTPLPPHVFQNETLTQRPISPRQTKVSQRLLECKNKIAELAKELEPLEKKRNALGTKIASESINAWGHSGKIKEFQNLQNHCVVIQYQLDELKREMKILTGSE